MNDNDDKIGEVLFKGKTVDILKIAYRTNDRVAISLTQGEMPFGVLTVNLPDEEFEEGEFAVKDWTENEEITPFILAHTDLFEDTGKTVPTGRVEAPIWRLKKEE